MNRKDKEVIEYYNDDYNIGQIISFVMIGIGGLLLILYFISSKIDILPEKKRPKVLALSISLIIGCPVVFGVCSIK